MSPEQVTGQEMDGRSDLYSLGVVAFETLSGKLPFDGPAPVVIVAHAIKPAPPLASVAPHVPMALCAVVDRCLRKDPGDRYESGDALAAAFEEAVGRSVATTPTKLAQGGEDRVLSEQQADRVWRRAAELQAGIDSPIAARAPTSSMTIVPRTATNGFRLEHVRAAAIEAGISAAYVTLALDELLRRGVDRPVPFARSPEPPATRPPGPSPVPKVLSLSPRASRVPGAPMSLAFEVQVPGEVSPNDFDVIAHTIRATFGEAGIASTLGRSLSWSTGGMSQKERQLHVSVSVSAGRTIIRAEERLSQIAGAFFGGIGGGVGGGLGFGSLGVTLGAMHMPLVALCFTGGTLVTSFLGARALFKGVAHRRAEELEGLVGRLAVQVSELVAYDRAQRALP
jgi:hypothetical protein